MTLVANIPALIPELYQGAAVKGYFLNHCLYDIFSTNGPLYGMSVSGGVIRWRMETDGTNNAAAVAEDDAGLTPNANSVIKLYQALQAYETDVKLSYESIDFSASDADPYAMDIEKGGAQLRDIAVTTMIAKWVADIDSAGTVYGETRASYANGLTSYEDDTTEALSLDDINAAIDALGDAQRFVAMSDLAIYTGRVLASRYSKLANQSIDFSRQTTRVQGEGVDGGAGFTMRDRYLTGMRHDGIPIYSLPEFTSGAMLLGPVSEVYISDPLGIRIKEKVPANRAVGAQMDTYANLVVAKPASWAKLANKS